MEKTDETYACQSFNINGHQIVVSVPIYKENPKYLHIREPEINLDLQSGIRLVRQVHLADKVEFFDEIQELVNYINGKEVCKQVIWDAFDNLCQNHIRKFGRLVDNDLNGYLVDILILNESICKTFNGDPLTAEQYHKVKDVFKKNAFWLFYDFLYINTSTEYFNPRLTKYSDMYPKPPMPE